MKIEEITTPHLHCESASGDAVVEISEDDADDLLTGELAPVEWACDHLGKERCFRDTRNRAVALVRTGYMIKFDDLRQAYFSTLAEAEDALRDWEVEL